MAVSKLGSFVEQVEEMEKSLTRIKDQVPDLPFTAVVTARLVMHLGREMSNMIGQRLRPFGLSEIEYRALMLVYSYRKTSAYPGDLCLSLAQSPANITRLTDTLVSRGLISRVPDQLDRRRLVLQVTSAGTELAEIMLPVMGGAVAQSFQDFSPQQVEQLLSDLKKLAKALDQASLQQTPAAASLES